jgi:hypothetical protein
MSTVTATTFNTANSSTNVTLRTGNTNAGYVVVNAGGGLELGSNSTTSAVSVSSAGVTTFNGNVVISNTTISRITSSVIIQGTTTANAISAANVTVQTANVTSNTLSLGSPTLAVNGSSLLPNGLRMNWGWVSTNSSVGLATFTTPFTTLYNVQGTVQVSGTTYALSTTGSNTSTASFRTANATSANVFWQAIGV